MADIKISQLPAAASASGTQEFEVNDSGTSRKVTGSQIEAFVKGSLVVADITDLTASATELNYVDGVTSDIQTQLNNRVTQTSSAGAAAIPTGTQAQRPTPATGQLRFNTDAGSFEGYDGSAWGSIGGGAVNDLFYENGQIVAQSYTIPTTRNAMSTGPITINAGVTVTVSAGARYVVI